MGHHRAVGATRCRVRPDPLTDTVAEPRPKLLVLDPFVRLHRIDENISGKVAPLLACLRELRRRFHIAVVLVHHARKGGRKDAVPVMRCRLERIARVG